jgi:hypothetical protein
VVDACLYRWGGGGGDLVRVGCVECKGY